MLISAYWQAKEISTNNSNGPVMWAKVRGI